MEALRKTQRGESKAETKDDNYFVGEGLELTDDEKSHRSRASKKTIRLSGSYEESPDDNGTSSELFYVLISDHTATSPATLPGIEPFLVLRLRFLLQ
jgi:hypothetical protein